MQLGGPRSSSSMLARLLPSPTFPVAVAGGRSFVYARFGADGRARRLRGGRQDVAAWRDRALPRPQGTLKTARRNLDRHSQSVEGLGPRTFICGGPSSLNWKFSTESIMKGWMSGLRRPRARAAADAFGDPAMAGSRCGLGWGTAAGR